MGLDVISQEVAGAELRAIAALIASGLTDTVPVMFGLVFTLNKVMVFRENYETGCSFGNYFIKIKSKRAHHHSANKDAEIL